MSIGRLTRDESDCRWTFSPARPGLLESAVIDYRQITFDPVKITGITLVHDQYLGLAIVAQRAGSFVLASLSPATPFEAIFLRPDEGPGPRFYIPNCDLRLDPSSAVNPREDPPLGSLIVAERGISIMVRPPRSGPSPLALTGDSAVHPYEGVCISRWRLQSDPRLGEPEVLYSAGGKSETAPQLDGL